MDHLAQLKLQRGAEHLHMLGPRAVAEFLAEVSSTIGGLPAIQSLLVEYRQRLTPQMVRAVGAYRFPSRPFLVIGAARSVGD